MILSHRLRAAAGNSGLSIVETGLKLHYDFGDTNCWNVSSGSGNITDLTGNNNNAYFNNYSGYTQNTTVGFVQKTNGSNISMNSNHLRLNGGSPWSLEYWHDPESGMYAQGSYFYEYWDWHYRLSDGAQNHYQWGLGFLNTGGGNTTGLSGYNIGVGNGSNQDSTWANAYPTNTTTAFESSPPYTYGTNYGWEQIVYSRENTNTNGFKIYRNGTLIYTGTEPKHFNQVLFGGWIRFVDYANIFANINNSKIGIFRMYMDGSASGGYLTAADVQQNYQAQKARFGLS